MRRNSSRAIAELTGGEYASFADKRSLDRDLGMFSNHVRNRYLLSFQPQSPREGYHALKLSVPNYAHLQVAGRSGYWAEPAGTSATPSPAAPQ